MEQLKKAIAEAIEEVLVQNASIFASRAGLARDAADNIIKKLQPEESLPGVFSFPGLGSQIDEAGVCEGAGCWKKPFSTFGGVPYCESCFNEIREPKETIEQFNERIGKHIENVRENLPELIDHMNEVAAQPFGINEAESGNLKEHFNDIANGRDETVSEFYFRVTKDRRVNIDECSGPLPSFLKDIVQEGKIKGCDHCKEEVATEEGTNGVYCKSCYDFLFRQITP